MIHHTMYSTSRMNNKIYEAKLLLLFIQVIVEVVVVLLLSIKKINKKKSLCHFSIVNSFSFKIFIKLQTVFRDIFNTISSFSTFST